MDIKKYNIDFLNSLTLKQVAEILVNNYFNYCWSLVSEDSFKEMVDNFPKLGLEKVLDIQIIIKKRLEKNKFYKRENVCSLLNDLLAFYKINVLDKTPLPPIQ
jgi:preprotein translocase subunit Sec63